MAVKVLVTPTSFSIKVGLTRFVYADVNGGPAGVTWGSSDAAKATVNSTTGLVTAVAAGTTNITATSTADGSKTAVCAVTVTAAITLSVSPTTVTLNGSGTTQQLTPTLGNSTQGVTYTSSAPTIATVTSLGLVTVVKAGSATITAKSVEDPAKTATCVVTAKVKVNVVTPQTVIYGDSVDISGFITGYISNSAVTYTKQSGTAGSVTAAGRWTANLTAGSDVIRVLSAEDVSVFIDVTMTAAATTTGAHRIHANDPDNHYAQSVLQERLITLDPLSAEFAICQSAVKNLGRFGT